MAKRNSWATIFSRGIRGFNKLQRSAARAVTKAATTAAKSSTKPRTKLTPKPPTQPPTQPRTRPGAQQAVASPMRSGNFGVHRYYFFRPAGHAANAGLPLLVMLHGCQQNAESFAASTRMNRLAARLGFCVLYPQQDLLANAQGCWNWFDTDSGRADREAAWIMGCVEALCARRAADANRVAVAGLSAGASMAALLAVHYPDRFKAVVMHSGVPPGTAHSTLTALAAMRGRRKTNALASLPSAGVALPPLLVIHGSADRVVVPRNAAAAAQQWADAAGATAGTARVVQRGSRQAMSVLDFKCGNRLVATLAQVEGLGHAWSGGAAQQAFSDPSGPEASRMVWAFAARRFRI